MVLRRPRLARVRMDAVSRPRAGAVLRVLLQHVRDLPGDRGRDRALRLRLPPARVAVDLPAGEDDLRDRHRLRIDAARSERRVRGRHVERRHREGAEAYRRHRPLGQVHAEPFREVPDVLRPGVERELGVDGVVGSERGARDRHRPDVTVVVRLDVPAFAAQAVGPAQRAVRAGEGR